ncbi:hypothetical protein [Neogemmobacter tilapiae]|uniref:hypothetical protein n=1 Tax=Neogemmobacter tilapiae TaxID=875041 RepID=UPI001679967B|nr:hypothetical protein [Gemmobacter tilapiae]
MRETLEKIDLEKVGLGKGGQPVAKVLNIPGQTFWTRFGVPPQIVTVLDGLFEGLPWPEARALVVALPEAIRRPGRDLRSVIWRLLAAETEVMRNHLGDLARGMFLDRLAGQVGQGLLLTANGRLWRDGMEVLDYLPRTLPPATGWDRDALLVLLDHDCRKALKATVLALLLADRAIATAWRARKAAARDLQEIRAGLVHAQDDACRSVETALRAFIATGAHAAALAAPSAEGRAEAADLARLIGYRRQAACLLHLVRSE